MQGILPLMTEIMTSSIRDRLWHKMRSDLTQYIPEMASNDVLMCCACGRFLRQAEFSLEHLIPKQALKHDPQPVRLNPDTPENVRAGNLLLCRKPLKLQGKIVYENGCNSWKGKHYDRALADLLGRRAWQPERTTQVHMIAALCLGYFAMVAEFGYRVALMPSGVMMREQFFSPRKFHRDMPVLSQMLLGGDITGAPYDAPMWAQPFSFTFRQGGCHFVSRNFSVTLPVTQDPRQPIAKHLRFAPTRFVMRPDFTTAFQ